MLGKTACCFFVLALLTAIPLSLSADEPLPPMDVVFMVDVSGSMRFTDPERITLSAIADFIDRLTNYESRVGVVGFNGAVQYYIPFGYVTDLRKEELREEIAGFIFTGFTDIGLALRAVVDMLVYAGELRNPVIIFTSDGYIQISRLNLERTAEMSYLDIELALDELDRRIPVYTIGMHNEDGIDVPLLEMIAERSNALSKFTYDARELPGILNEILLHHVERILYPEQAVLDTEETTDEEYEESQQEEPDEHYELTEDYEEDSEYYDLTEEENDALVYENNGFVLGILHYLAIFFGLTATVGVISFVRTVLF